MILKPFIAFCLFVTLASPAYAQDPQEVLIKMDAVMSAPSDWIATVEMTTTNRKGVEKTHEARLKQLGSGYRLYRYTRPENKAGIASLSLPDGNMWLYMPSFGKAIKISLLSKSQAFTGTDFSHEDMSGIPYSERYTADFENSRNEGEYLLNLLPKSNNTSYSRILLSVDKKNGHPVQMAFYDKNGVYFKKAVYTYARQGKYWYAKEVTMTDLTKDHSTKVIMKEITFDTGLSKDEFTVEMMKNSSEH
ncbi:outer membrane lipoprotein-sorting protein [Robiginitalea sp.]|jgi:outer membrane lipoprotein-sorting protein|uniref:outer membrane lipoprotein-sorting protein n=1 Tax=Robiginitalea sp. TaxID=1902411 RepID=UPI003C78DF0C